MHISKYYPMNLLDTLHYGEAFLKFHGTTPKKMYNLWKRDKKKFIEKFNNFELNYSITMDMVKEVKVVGKSLEIYID